MGMLRGVLSSFGTFLTQSLKLLSKKIAGFPLPKFDGLAFPTDSLGTLSLFLSSNSPRHQ